MKVLRLSRLCEISLLALACCLGLPSVAHADLIIDANSYCSAGSNATNTFDTNPGSLLSVNDVTLTVTGPAPQYTSSDCYGDFGIQSQDEVNETSALNAIFGAASGPDQLHYLDKYNFDNSAAPPSNIGLDGITFVVETSGGSDGAPGSWTVTWTDTNALLPQNLPITVDLAVVLMGGNNMAAYLLSDVLLPASPTSGSGVFDIQFVNHGGRQPTISHLTLAGRIVPSTKIIEVPEPASVLMWGAGLLGLWTLRGRRKSGSDSHVLAEHLPQT
jgi:hypothetical protein